MFPIITPITYCFPIPSATGSEDFIPINHAPNFPSTSRFLHTLAAAALGLQRLAGSWTHGLTLTGNRRLTRHPEVTAKRTTGHTNVCKEDGRERT